MRGMHSLRKYLVLGAVAAAPIVTAGCSNAVCDNAKTSPCGTPVFSASPCAAAPVRTVRAPRAAQPVVYKAAQPAPVVYASAPAQPVVYASAPSQPVVYAAETAYAGDASSVVYKPIGSRSIANALANVDPSSLSGTNSTLVSSVASSAEYAALNSGAPVSYPTSYPAASYPVEVASYPAAGVSYPVEVASYPAAATGGYVVSEMPAGYALPTYTAPTYAAPVYGVPVDAGVNTQRHFRGPRGHRGPGRQQRVIETGSIPSGTPVYVTPGGTTVSAYVPAPASGTYLGGAAPTGYLPVTERRGPNDAVIHYATRSICKYDPARGEDCVWTSGF